MKIEFDRKADAMYIHLAAGVVDDSEEVRPGVVLDFDANSRVLGIEMLEVSRRADNPRETGFEPLAKRTRCPRAAVGPARGPCQAGAPDCQQ